MEWKTQLSKTPVLVLFIVLISIGVGTASALITITLAGNVNVLGDLNVDGDTNAEGFLTVEALVIAKDDVEVRGDLKVGTDNSNDDDFIRFDGGNENIMWDESETLFRFSDAIATGGHAQFGSLVPDGVNRFGDGVPTNDMTGFGDLFVADDLEVGDNAFIDDHLFLGNSNGDTNIFFFDDGANNNESIFWDDSLDRFTTTNDLHVGGKLSMDGGVDPPYVSFTSETHNTIRELSQETEDKEEVMVFWNTELKQMEVYVIAEDKFYTFDGQLVE